ncbi:MAG TPA: hypothetical protein VFY74_00190 [Methyloceanibacter sp.]|jgi:uncharacterized membrane protein|nr:hypothetical protein [Methyloceanibacter sp.]
MGFSVRSALRFGWETFKKRPWFFVLAMLLIVIAQGLVQGIGRASDASLAGAAEELGFLASLVHLALSTLVSMGVTAFALAAHDNPDTVELSALWHPHPFWKYLGLSIIFALVAVAAFLLGLALVAVLGLETGLAIGIPLLLVLGAIFALMFMFSGFLVIDRELGPIEAMKGSYRMTYGYKWSLLGLLLMLLLINVLGLLALIVGLFVSAPVSLLAATHAYRVLGAGAGTRPADAALAA